MIFGILFSFASLSCALINLLLFLVFTKAKSIPATFVVGWLFLVNLCYGINAAVWHGDTSVRSRVYCDIATKLLIGVQMAISATAFYLAAEIYFYVADRDISLGVKSKTWRRRNEAMVCLLAPLVFMCFQFAVQERRFDIVQGVGCLPVVSNSIFALFVIWLPLLLPCMGTIVYLAKTYKYVANMEYGNGASWREAIAERLLWSSAPFNLDQLLCLVIMTFISALWMGVVSITAIVVSVTAGMSTIRKPDIEHIDKFASIFDAPVNLGPVYILLYTGPLYSILLLLLYLKSYSARKDEVILGEKGIHHAKSGRHGITGVIPILFPREACHSQRREPSHQIIDYKRLSEILEFSFKPSRTAPDCPSNVDSFNWLPPPYTGQHVACTPVSKPAPAQLARQNQTRYKGAAQKAMDAHMRTKTSRPLCTIPEDESRPIGQRLKPVIHV